MIEAAELQREYKLVHGDPKNVKGMLKIGDLHIHEGGDTTDTPGRIVSAAIRRGLDLIAVTNHDNPEGYDRASRTRDRLERRRSGHSLTVVRATEVTAQKGVHVLVYNLTRSIPIGLPLTQLLEEVDRQKATASMAHPELGNFSPNDSDIEGLLEADSVPFALEVHNGGARQIDMVKDWHLPKFVRRRIPEAGSNDRAKAIFERLKNALNGATGGSDAHNARHVGDVITCWPANMDVFESIANGSSFIMERRRMPRPTVTNAIIGTVRANMLDRKRQRGELGFSI